MTDGGIADEGTARRWLSALPQVDALALGRLERLIELLKDENCRQNLVMAASLDSVWTRHVVDSAQLLRHLGDAPRSLLDLGTGAGFPGLVLAVLLPDTRVVMVESRRRRAQWLQSVVDDLGLVHAAVAGTRVEVFPAETFDVISARAFAPLDRLLDLSARFSTPATRWLLPKGRSARQELEGLQGWKHMFHVKQSLTDADAGIIVGELLGKKGSRR